MDHTNPTTPQRRTSRWRNGLLGLAAALFMAPSANAQVAAYSFAQTSGTYAAVTGTPLGTATNDDNSYTALPIGFSFTYNGVAYTTFSANANGFMAMGSTISSSYVSISGGATNNVVAGMNADLQGQVGSSMQYTTTGSAPNRQLVMQWTNYKRYGTSGTGQSLNWQIVLNEAGGVAANQTVQIIYGANTFNATSSSAQVGLRGASSADYNNRSTATNWNSTIAGAVNSATCTMLNTVTTPASGLTFTWTPPSSCTSAPSAGTIPATASYCSPGTTTLSSTGFTTGEAGITFQWEESDDNGVGDAWVNAVGGSGATTTTYTTATLTSPTVRYYRLKATCSAVPGSPGYSGSSLVSPVAINYATYTGTSYTQDFESWTNRCNTTDVPSVNWVGTPATGNNSWRRDDQSTSGAWSGSGGPYTPVFTTGAHSARFHSYNSSNGLQGSLDLYIDMSAAAGNSEIKFDQINPSGSDVLAVLVSTDGGTNFTQLGANLGAATAWTPRTFTMTTNSATTVVRLRATSDYGNDDIGVDNFRILPPPTCAPPTAVSVTGVTETTASVNFTGSGAATYDYEIRTSGAAGSGATGLLQSGNVAGSPIALSGLSASTTYSVYLRGSCVSPTATSTWTMSVNFNTPCGAVNVPYTQDFESAVIPAFPNCMSVQNVNGSNTWTTATSTYLGPSSKVARYVYNGSTAANDWFYTPGINLVGGTSYSLSYTYGSADYNEALEVYYGTSASAASMTNLVVNHGTFNTAPFTVSYTITPASNGVYYIGWHAYSAADMFYLDVDNISVVVAPSCLPAAGITATPTSTTTADITFTGSGALSYNYEIRTSGAAGSGATGLFTSGNVAASPINLTGLTEGTPYSVYMQGVCTGPSTSAWSSATNFTIAPPGWTCENPLVVSAYPYTASSTTCGAINDYGVQCGGFYGAGEDFVYQLNITATGPYTIDVTPTGGGSYIGWFLKGGAGCANAGTCLTNATAASGTASGTYNFTTAGTYYLIIDTWPAPACSAYDIAIAPPPTCIPPTAVNVTGVTGTTASVNFTGSGAATYDYEIRTSGAAGSGATGLAQSGNVAGSPIALTGLTAATTYSVYLRGSCVSPTATSTWTTSVNFNTPCGAFNVPYTQDFESAVIPAFPNCMSVENVNGNTTWTTATSTYVGPSSKAARYTYSSTSAANDWFYTAGINLVGGTNYTLSYTYGAAGFNESLEVYYGTSASAASMTNLVVDNGTFLNGPFTVSYTITPAATGVYYFGWHAYSDADEFWLDVDNISVVLAPAPDCLGVPGGSATIGSACDDGNASTGNDVYDANCVCVGQTIDCLGVPGGSATIGSSCDDGNASTGNDVYDASCNCVGQLIDCLGVPGGTATIGSACDDGNASTIDDTWSANCTCEGTPVGACTGNEIVVAITTDNNPGQITWEMTNESNVVIATGGPTAGQNNMLVSTTVCLGAAPTSACYGFTLTDSFGDGIIGGNWQLRSTSGKVLLGDDFANGYRSPSATPANPSYTQHSFCLPVGNTHIAARSCGIFNFTPNSNVYCTNAPGATSNQFEFSNPDAGFIRRITVNTNKVRFNQMVTSPLTPGVKYFVRARNNAAGPVTDAHFGGGCEVAMSSTIPCTELISAPQYGHSCNETRAFNPSTNNSFIYAQPVNGATEYQFRISIPGEGYDETFIRSTYILQLKWNATVAPPLVNGSTYNVQVNVKVGTLYSGFCGDVCTITIDNSANRPEASMSQVAFGETTLWPNPVRESQVNLSIDGIQDADQNITVDIQDIYGKKVFAKEFGNSGDRFTTILDLPSDIASGIYMVNITVNGQTTVQRLSIIK